MVFVRTFADYLLQALILAIFLRAILSWFVPGGGDNPIMSFLYGVTEPILAPLRRVLPSMGMLDLSALVAIVLLQLVKGYVVPMLFPLY